MDRMTYVRHDAPGTSREAAQRAKGTAQGDAQIILEFIRLRDAEGATADEVILGTGLPYNTATARMRGLKDNGLIKHPQGWNRPTRTGSPAQVWVIT